jgi:septum site-determining protein MinC
MALPDLFATETMADLCVRQGRSADAIAIYRSLVARAADDARRKRLQERLETLLAIGAPLKVPLTSESNEPQPPSAKPPTRLPRTIHQPVRSGQVVYAEGGDLLVLAPVNVGAQVIADGNIHIYAPLRGRAVAGAHGCLEARIFCQRLEAELVGIDAAYLTADGIPPERFANPAQVLMDGDRCVVVGL